MSTFVSTIHSSTYDAPVAARTKTEASVAPRQGAWARFFNRLMDARMRAAERELHRHGLRLPSELEAAGWKISSRNEDSLPFVR